MKNSLKKKRSKSLFAEIPRKHPIVETQSTKCIMHIYILINSFYVDWKPDIGYNETRSHGHWQGVDQTRDLHMAICKPA